MDNGRSEFSEIHSSNAVRTIPWVDSPPEDGTDPGRKNIQRTDIVAGFVYDLEHREVFNFCIPIAGDDHPITWELD